MQETKSCELSKSEFESLMDKWILSPRHVPDHPVFQQAAQCPGEDVLGEYYEKNICQRESEQFFTPKKIVQFMNESTASLVANNFNGRTPYFTDPACGSGRFALDILARGYQNVICIDVDLVCVKMTLLNLFLAKARNAVVLWGDTLSNECWQGYHVSDVIRIASELSFEDVIPNYN